MIAVIFEVEIRSGKQDDYLQQAEQLKPLLADIDGFISVERFSSLADQQKVLSLSFWRDEAAVKQWREQSLHQMAQSAGRSNIFADYRIRVAEVTRDYSLTSRQQAPGNNSQ